MPDSAIMRDWRCAGDEPTLAEIFTEPIMHLMMRRDGVDSADLLVLIGQVQLAIARIGTVGRN
jgi:hypothetical protein